MTESFILWTESAANTFSVDLFEGVPVATPGAIVIAHAATPEETTSSARTVCCMTLSRNSKRNDDATDGRISLVVVTEAFRAGA
jgi:hypothetical protein